MSIAAINRTWRQDGLPPANVETPAQRHGICDAAAVAAGGGFFRVKCQHGGMVPVTQPAKMAGGGRSHPWIVPRNASPCNEEQ